MHPDLVNRTPFSLSLLYIGREPDGQLHGVSLVQGTWRIGADGTLRLLDLQPDPPAGGEWYGDPARSSLRLEPQTAAFKPYCDIAVLGHAVAPAGQLVRRMRVRVAVGAWSKEALVIGDRQLARGLTGLVITPPEPFERMPLVYERAYGGWDQRHEEPSQHRCEARNPVGVGFRDSRLPACEEQRLPNIEDPLHPFAGHGDAPPPCGFGFISASWMPRAAFGGTYDDQWSRARSPLLPTDFDPRFHNAASPGLIATSPLAGQEMVHLEGLSEAGVCRFRLPGVPAPWCAWSLRRRDRRSAPLQLDTVIIDMDRHWLSLQWRGSWPLPDGPHALESVEVRLPTGLDKATIAALTPAASLEGS